MLTENTKMIIYQACVLSTLLYGSESWTTYMCQERRLNTFHMRCLKRILGITWQDRIPYSDILDRAKIRSMYSLLSPRRLRWLGHVRRTEDGRMPKDILYGQLTSGARPVGRPALRFKDACNRDMKACDINPKGWEAVAEDRVRKHAEALKRQMKRNTSMRLRRGCGEHKKQHYHQCHPGSSALAAARTATQESAFTATVDAANI